MPYIPQFNKLSMSEMAYAPTLMRQQHDDAVAKQMELAEAMKFDYLQQDANTLEPVLQKYNDEIGKVSTDLAKSGFTHDTKNKILGLRSQFTGDDKIRHIKKRYSDAMAGWEDRKKSLMQQRATGEDINHLRKAYFASTAPAYDDIDGFKQEFTPGATSNVYDISEDIKSKFANIGSTEVVYGGSGVKAVRETLGKGTPYETQAWKILDSTGGTKASNLSQREAVKALTLSEYTDPSSDRALYAKLTNKSPEYISNLVDQWSDAMAKDEIGQVAQTRGNYVFDKPAEEEDSSGDRALLTYGKTAINSKQFKEADERSKILSGELKGTKTGLRSEIEGVEQYVGADNPFQISRDKVRSAEEVAIDQNKRTPRYVSIFANKINPQTGKTYTDIEIAQKGAEAEKNASAYIEKSTVMNIDKKSLSGQTAAEVVLLNMINPGNKAPLTQIGGKIFGGDKKISKAKFMELAGDKWNTMPVEFYNNGDITITDFSGNRFKVNTTGTDNEGVLEDGTSKLYNNVYVPILNKLTAFNLHDDDELDSPVQAPDGYLYDVVTPDGGDPYNVGHRLVRRSIVDPTSKERYQVGPLISPEQFKQDFLKQTALSSTNIQVQ